MNLETSQLNYSNRPINVCVDIHNNIFCVVLEICLDIPKTNISP